MIKTCTSSGDNGGNNNWTPWNRRKNWADLAWQRSCWWRPARHEAETHDERNEADDQSDMLLNLTSSRHDLNDQPIMLLKCIFLSFYWLLNDRLTTWRGDNRYGSAEVVMTARCLYFSYVFAIFHYFFTQKFPIENYLNHEHNTSITLQNSIKSRIKYTRVKSKIRYTSKLSIVVKNTQIPHSLKMESLKYLYRLTHFIIQTNF